MALFGKKAQDAPTGTAPDDFSGAVAVADDGTAAGSSATTKRAKAARQPKAAKSKTVKSGVAVGLNIGNQFIKAVEVTSKGGELSVTAMGAVPTPPESFTNGNVLSVSALSNAIKDLWRTAGIKSKVTVTSVAGTGALVVRVIEVPKMTDGELSDNMKVDADRYIPFPPSEVVMDFKALRDLPSDPDAPNMEVLLAAAQREIIDLHVRVVQNAKLDPRAIDVETIAATRALQLERRGSNEYIDYNEVTGVVNLGATGAEISILRGDIVVFTRVVPNGGNSITQAISEGLGLPFSDAERLKIVNADALAPAGYGAASGDDFAFGAGGGDFDFGGDEFSGGDFNSAFEDISSNPGAAPASDDPFDLDFFNQGPEKDEPGAGHAQKEGEDDTTPAFSFDFGDLSSPATPPAPTPQQGTPPSEPATTDPISFDFGEPFDDDFLPAVSNEAEATPVSEPNTKGTAQLDDFAFDAADTTPLPSGEETAPAVTPPASPAATSASAGYSSLIPSAFDFDNFDLPGIQEEGASTVSTPVTPAPVTPASVAPAPAAPAPAAPVVPPATFDLDTPAPTPPADVQPASFGLESEPTVSTEDAPQNQPASFDFAFSAPAEPAAAPISTPEADEASLAFAPLDEAPPVAEVQETNVAESPAPAAQDDFDLDSIFGATDTPASPATAATAGSVAGAGAAATALPADSGDFDLSGIETDLGSFAGGFGDQTDDFTAFGAGLSDTTATDAATLYSLIYPALEELSNEVRRSLEFHLGRYPDATISRLVLHGGGAKLRNLDVFFTQSLGVPTVVANPFTNITVNTPKLPPEYATENGPLCTVALGLALRDFVD